MEGFPYQLSLFTAGAGCLGFCLWRLREWYRVRAFGLKDIPGPRSESQALGSFSHTPPSYRCSPARRLLTGNMRQLYQSEVGELDFRWQEEFGGIMRLKGPFGVRLWCCLYVGSDTNLTCDCRRTVCG